MSDDHFPASSATGLRVLAYASSRDHTVLDFETDDSGELTVMDVTDHVEELEDNE